MPWRPATVGMFLKATAKVPASRPRDAGHVITFPALSSDVAHSRCGSLGNATFDALDVPIERAEGGVGHHAACGNHFFPAIVLDRSGEGVQRAGDDLGLGVFDSLDAGPPPTR